MARAYVVTVIRGGVRHQETADYASRADAERAGLDLLGTFHGVVSVRPLVELTEDEGARRCRRHCQGRCSMSKTTINFYGVKVAVDYSYSRGYSGGMEQPPEPEGVELNSVTLEGHSIDIYSLMGDDRVAELSELALHAHKEQEEIARDYAADARRDFAEHVSDDWMGDAA